MIEFISYEEFPEDNYTKEIVYLQIEGKYRVAYVPRMMKTGEKKWFPMSTGAIKNGQRQYFPAIEYDSTFVKKDIEAFLESRPWEKTQIIQQQQKPQQTYTHKDENNQEFQGYLPF